VSARARKLSYGGTAKLQRVGHPVDHVEERGDMDRVDDGSVAHASRAYRVGIRWPSSSGRSVSFSMKPSIARSFSSTGAVRQSR